MGCGIGKRNAVPKVDLTLGETGDPRIDSVFHELEVPLATLQKAEKKLKTALKVFQQEVGTYKQLKNSSFFDSLMAMFFCFSVSGEGNLDNIEFSYSQDPPYIKVNSDLLYLEHRKIIPAWTRLIHLAEKLPGKLEPLGPLLSDAVNDTTCEDYIDIPGDSDTSFLNQSSVRTRKTVSTNQMKLAQAPAVLEEVLRLLQEINQTVFGIPDLLSDGNVTIMTVGRKAYSEQILNPRDIVTLYWPQPSPR